MSTFTDWNGPQSSNIRANDLIKFADAYQTMLSKLNDYEAQMENLRFDAAPIAGSTNILSSGAVATALNDLRTMLNGYLTTQAAADNYATKAELGTKADSASLATKADKTELNAYATTHALELYLLKENLSTEDVIVALRTDIDNLQSALNNVDGFTRPILKARDYFEGMIKAVHQIYVAPKTFNAPISGTDNSGVYYCLGMLTNDTGTVFVTFKNTSDFSAKVDFAAIKRNGEWHGSLSILTNANLNGLKFILANGTGRDGEEHVYLGVGADAWRNNFASTDSQGLFADIAFMAGGVNVAPFSAAGFVIQNGSTHAFAECAAVFGTSASEMTIENAHVTDVSTDCLKDSQGNKIFEVTRSTRGEEDMTVLTIGNADYTNIHFKKRPSMSIVPEGSDQPMETPFITAKDIESNVTPVGTVIEWGAFDVVEEPFVDSNGDPVLDDNGDQVMTEKYVLKNIPDGWLPLDGSAFDVLTYPTLAGIYPDGTLPVADFKIVKAAEITSGTGADDDTQPEELINYDYVNNRLNQLAAEVATQRLTDTRHDSQLAGTTDSGLKQSIDTEIANRTSADTGLQTAIDAETSTRTAEDTRIEGRINQEISNRTSADTTLQTAIETEASARTTADSALQTAIDTEAGARATADTTLQTAIDAETSARTTADTALQTAIDTEAGTRLTEDTRIEGKVDQEISDRADADTALQSAINRLNNGAVLVYTGTTAADLPTSTPDTAGRTITTGQQALLKTDTGVSVYVASVDAGGNVTWSEA